MAISDIASVVVKISNVSIIEVSVWGRHGIMLVMVVIAEVMSLVAKISIVPIVACTISIGIHICIVATAYTVINLRSIAATCTCMVASCS